MHNATDCVKRPRIRCAHEIDAEEAVQRIEAAKLILRHDEAEAASVGIDRVEVALGLLDIATDWLVQPWRREP